MDYIDSSEFAEELIKHLIRDKKCYRKAKDLNLTADLFGDSETGNRVYREFVNIVMEVDDSPITWEVFAGHYKNKFENGKFDTSQEDQIIEFIEAIYNGELSSDYILRLIPDFVKRKKTKQLQHRYKDDPDSFTSEYSKINIEIKRATSGAVMTTRMCSPMDTYVPPSFSAIIPTGLTSIDGSMRGLGLQELGFVLGASGAGKSTLAVVLAKNAAGLGKKVLYVTLEEGSSNIRDRFLSSLLDLSYSNLHAGIIEAAVVQKKIDDFERKTMYFNNLKILDLKDRSPLTVADLEEAINKECKELNFLPDLILIDQMDYIDSNIKFVNEWQKYQQVAFDLDLFSHTLIGGTKPFGLYVMHQLKGDMKLEHHVEDISSFKGVVKPADVVLTIGRANPDSYVVKIKSLKVRHNKNFGYLFKGNFENMTLLELPKGTKAYVKPEEPKLKYHIKVLE